MIPAQGAGLAHRAGGGQERSDQHGVRPVPERGRTCGEHGSWACPHPDVRELAWCSHRRTCLGSPCSCLSNPTHLGHLLLEGGGRLADCAGALPAAAARIPPGATRGSHAAPSPDFMVTGDGRPPGSDSMRNRCCLRMVGAGHGGPPGLPGDLCRLAYRRSRVATGDSHSRSPASPPRDVVVRALASHIPAGAA